VGRPEVGDRQPRPVEDALGQPRTGRGGETRRRETRRTQLRTQLVFCRRFNSTRTLLTTGLSSLHRLRQPLHVGVHLEAVSPGQRGERSARGPAFPLLDSAELPLREALHFRLRKPSLLADLADHSPVPLVEALAPLLGLSELFRIDRLNELV